LNSVLISQCSLIICVVQKFLIDDIHRFNHSKKYQS